MITARQRDLLCFIANFQRRTGETPTYDEMRIGLGLESTSGIHRMIHGLEERRYIKRSGVVGRRGQTIEILVYPMLPAYRAWKWLGWSEEAGDRWAELNLGFGFSQTMP